MMRTATGSRTDFDVDANGTIDRTTETGAPPISGVALSSLDGTNGFILNGINAGDQSRSFRLLGGGCQWRRV